MVASRRWRPGHPAPELFGVLHLEHLTKEALRAAFASWADTMPPPKCCGRTRRGRLLRPPIEAALETYLATRHARFPRHDLDHPATPLFVDVRGAHGVQLPRSDEIAGYQPPTAFP